MNYDKIGLLIKNLRIKNNMSQNDLARELGIGRENISKWENGVSLPDVENLIIISKIFKVSVDELLLGELTNNDNKENKDIYYELYKEKNKKNESLRRNIKLLTSLVLVLSVSSILFISYFLYDTYNKSIDTSPNIVEVEEENNEEEINKDLTYSSSLLNITKS